MLKQTIRSMHQEILRCDGNIPVYQYTGWELASGNPARWIISPRWEADHPGQVPDYNPNIVQDEPTPEVSQEINAPSEPII